MRAELPLQSGLSAVWTSPWHWRMHSRKELRDPSLTLCWDERPRQPGKTSLCIKAPEPQQSPLACKEATDNHQRHTNLPRTRRVKDPSEMCKCTDGHNKQSAAISSVETNLLKWMKPCVPVPKKPPWLTAVNCSFNDLFRLLPKPMEWLPCSWVRAATTEKSLYLPGLESRGGTSARGKPHLLCLSLPTRQAETPAPQAQQRPGRHISCRQHQSIPLCKRTSLAWKHLAFLQPQGTPSFPLLKLSLWQPVPVPAVAACPARCAWLPKGCTDLRCTGLGTHSRPAERAAALRCAWVICTATEC